MNDSRTVPGIGPGGWAGRQGLADAQEQHAREQAIVYRLHVGRRLYAEHLDAVSYIARYFDGATIIPATGLWRGTREYSFIVEIVATLAQLQAIMSLAGDLRVAFEQTTVLVTWQRCESLLLGEDTIRGIDHA